MNNNNEMAIYQIYPLGLCGAPERNDSRIENRLNRISDWIPHIKQLGFNAVYFGPVFESGSHGYDTVDFAKIDCRLGTNDDFRVLCDQLHNAGIRVILDGVFNHVGRGFGPFRDVLVQREKSPYLNWFQIRLDENNCFDDRLSYHCWEGHPELVQLNLKNPEVVSYLLERVREWIGAFGIDGLRLDVAYMLDPDFMRQLHSCVRALRPDFFLLGEMIHGDYRRLAAPGLLDSCTNYEFFKGLYSSFNDQNLFEIAYCWQRQDGAGGLYNGIPLVNFADNHDVNRIASLLKKDRHLRLLYGLLFAKAGIPCVYYGSEWGVKGEKRNGSDVELRPEIDQPVWNDLTDWIALLMRVRAAEPALRAGGYQQLFLTNRQFVFARDYDQHRILIAVNSDEQAAQVALPADFGMAENLLTGERRWLGKDLSLEGYSIAYWKRLPG